MKYLMPVLNVASKPGFAKVSIRLIRFNVPPYLEKWMTGKGRLTVLMDG